MAPLAEAVAAPARRRRASVVGLLPRTEEARGRDREPALAASNRRPARKRTLFQTLLLSQWDHRPRQRSLQLHVKAGIETMQSTDFDRRHATICSNARRSRRNCPDAAALPDEALLVKVTRFAFTANNITYAVLGDHLKYWQLFPAPHRFRQRSGVGIWRGDHLKASHGSPKAKCSVRLFPDGDASRHRSRRRQRSAACAMPPHIGRARRRSTTPMRASAAIRLCRQAGRLSGAAAAAVHAVVPGR